MGYYIEDKESKEQYKIKVLEAGIITYKYVWAYTFSEACSKCEDEGLEVLD